LLFAGLILADEDQVHLPDAALPFDLNQFWQDLAGEAVAVKTNDHIF
jgi:hypothetical protein